MYALVLTPTRELARQIQEQILAVGAPHNVTAALVTGGRDFATTGSEVSAQPHFIVGTPGRIRDLFESATPPRVKGLRFIVLDEADRLLATKMNSGFEGDIHYLLSTCGNSRVQVALYSATIGKGIEATLERVRKVTSCGKFARIVVDDRPAEKALKPKHTEAAVTPECAGKSKSEKGSDVGAPRIPAGLKQEYIFMPHQHRDAYLAASLRELVRGGGTRPDKVDGRDVGSGWTSKTQEEDDETGARSAIIFVNACERAAHLEGTFRELGVDCVALHSLLSQDRRNAALGKFKSQQVRVLIATDVASRGLDIPEVDLVLNSELPRKSSDYVHRVGRTARAGRRGLAVSLVGEEDVALVHACEKASGRELIKCGSVKDRDALKIMPAVAKASRLTKIRLMEIGFDDLVEKAKKRKTRDFKIKAKALAKIKKSKTTT